MQPDVSCWFMCSGRAATKKPSKSANSRLAFFTEVFPRYFSTTVNLNVCTREPGSTWRRSIRFSNDHSFVFAHMNIRTCLKHSAMHIYALVHLFYSARGEGCPANCPIKYAFRNFSAGHVCAHNQQNDWIKPDRHSSEAKSAAKGR